MARATQRLYLTASGDVVLHGDPLAVSLLCGVGSEIPAGFSEPTAEKVEHVPTEKVEADHTPKRRVRKLNEVRDAPNEA